MPRDAVEIHLDRPAAKMTLGQQCGAAWRVRPTKDGLGGKDLCCTSWQYWYTRWKYGV